ncbi:hypothetical protein OH76DRAFT_1552842 [Lentinus brumalis]|uniref:Uncharacterized protein n=1 Tax=Lentinus brumalis TaxID=2498619 RepID=A0A371DNC8_9APHY|nr:hypothetical protein OH76DRAFT_1552842 [Polyporus brumalis]
MKKLHDQLHVLEARERKHNAMMQQLRQETKTQVQIAAPQRHSADALNPEDSELRVLSPSPDPLHAGLGTSRSVTPLTRQSVDDEDPRVMDGPEMPNLAGKRKRSVDEDEAAALVSTSPWRAPLGRNFSSDWNITSQQSRRAGSSSKPQQTSAPAIHALDIDKSGKSNKLVRLGSRRSM